MGATIDIFTEIRNNETNQWKKSVEDVFTLDDYDKNDLKKEKGECPFNWQSYSLFGFLANVRNYSHCPPLSMPKGVPKNLSKDVSLDYKVHAYGAHSASYLTLRELIEFDYSKTFENRRTVKVTGQLTDYRAEAKEGEGKIITFYEHLGEMFFIHLNELKTLGEPDDVRVVFWFNC